MPLCNHHELENPLSPSCMVAKGVIDLSNGAWTESFQPGQATMNDMDQAQRAELLALFPELDGEVESYLAARPSLKRHEARIIAAA